MENPFAANPQKIRTNSFCGCVRTASTVDDNDLQRSTVIVNASSRISIFGVLNSVFVVDDSDENRIPTTSAHHALGLGRDRRARVRLAATTSYPEH